MESLHEMNALVQKALGLAESVSIEISPLKRRGSDRTYFRLNWDLEHSAILIHYHPRRAENSYYADIATFLLEIAIPVPRLICHVPESCFMIMEDLGDVDLWSLRDTSWETRRNVYWKILGVLHRLHSFPRKEFPSNRVRLMEPFSADLYRWERNYFKDHFVRGVCMIELERGFEQALERELSSLADRLTAGINCLIHRDLQSQNVMVKEGKPFFIDFQGMRYGNPFYDLGSLLYDPYVNFTDDERRELLSSYYQLSQWDCDWMSFQQAFWEASAQRLMQALGAYGFLGHVRGLKTYLEYMPRGLCNIKDATENAASLPCLGELLVRCQRVVEPRTAANAE